MSASAISATSPTPITRLEDFFSNQCVNLSNRKMTEMDLLKAMEYITTGLDIRQINLRKLSIIESQSSLKWMTIAIVIAVCHKATSYNYPLTIDLRECPDVLEEKEDDLDPMFLSVLMDSCKYLPKHRIIVREGLAYDLAIVDE